MTIIEQIKSYIERQIKDPIGYCYGVSSINKLRELLDFIGTLEESDKPVPNDLEEAARNHSNSWRCSALEELNETGLGCTGIEEAFIAGAKWMAEQLKK